MNDKKLTDSEIIKALEEVIELRFDDTEYATVKLDTLTNALDLINRLQAENERLKAENEGKDFYLNVEKDAHKMSIDVMEHYAKSIKSEAVKEFAERVKHKAINIGVNDSIVSTYAIDETYKELVGEGDA